VTQPSARQQLTLRDGGYTKLVHRALLRCLFLRASLRWHLLVVTPTHEGMTRLSWLGWLVTYTEMALMIVRNISTNRPRRKITSLIGHNVLTAIIIKPPSTVLRRTLVFTYLTGVQNRTQLNYQLLRAQLASWTEWQAFQFYRFRFLHYLWQIYFLAGRTHM